MKKIIIASIVASFLFAGTASAQMGMMNYGQQNNTSVTQSGQNSTIDAALQDIYKTQNVTDTSNISCAKVTDAQFEKLGDAVMGYGITEQQHTAMENMMGGEGSATLAQAHINMGRSYLGCWANYNSGPSSMPMMGYSSGSSTSGTYAQTGNYYSPQRMMDYGFNTGWGMMGGHNWFGWVTQILIWILLILGIVVLVKWLRKNK